MNKEIQFEKLHPHELEEILNTASLIYMPIGTLEWHERHLPFGLDAFTAYEIAKRTCRLTGGCILPPLYYGTDKVYEHDGKQYRGMNIQSKRILPGSIYPLDNELFYNMLKTIISNITYQGFKKLVIVSGHCETGQMEVLNRIYNEHNHSFIKLEVFPREGVFFEGSLDHAGELETRLMMAIDESLVDLSKINEPYEALIGEDPHKATKQEGETQLNTISKQLVKIIEKMDS